MQSLPKKSISTEIAYIGFLKRPLLIKMSCMNQNQANQPGTPTEDDVLRRMLATPPKQKQQAPKPAPEPQKK
jgi:hypothetical protein